MSREQHVEDLLSAYLDNALTQQERAFVATHIQTCSSCNDVLTDFRYFDTLLKKQPRFSPSAALYEQIFSSPEYLELVEDDFSQQFIYTHSLTSSVKNRQTVCQRRVRLNDASRPHLVSIPGKRMSPTSLSSSQETQAHIRVPKRQGIQIQRFMYVLIAACLFLTASIGSFIGWHLWLGQGKTAYDTQNILPPQDPRQGGPLPAGMRFVFLHDGSLWSEPEDGSTAAVRLTPTTVVVAPSWRVRPALSGHTAGDLLAYIDVKQGYIHIIRTDGQSDAAIKQPLLSTLSTASWNTNIGSTVLHSLSWSPDSGTLAFIAAPTGTPRLYTYAINTGQVQAVALPDNGAVSHLVWSPNAERIAFESIQNGFTNILDYNVQTRGVLTVASTITTAQHPDDTVLTLDWAPNNTPAITWSIGAQGQVHSIWLRYVGVSTSNGADRAQLLVSGNYTQAIYNRIGEGGVGSWLLYQTTAEHTNSLLTLTLTATLYKIADGSQIYGAQWAADGRHINYFDTFTSGAGTLHSIDETTNIDTLVASNVNGTPAPTWSIDGSRLLYSTGIHNFVFDTANHKTQLPLQGAASTFIWSTTSRYVAVVAIQGSTQGIYLVDTLHNTATSRGTKSVTGPIVWTEIP